jgi:protein-tyrosine-phosphatase
MTHHLPETGRPIEVLIVCTGNICRSPMAEGILKSIWPRSRDFQPLIQSAGTHATHGLPAEPHAIKAAAEFGADIRSHRSRRLTPAMITSADRILAMTQRHVEFIQNSGGGHVRLLCGPDRSRTIPEVPDPYGGSLNTYRECALMIFGCLQRLMAALNGISGEI